MICDGCGEKDNVHYIEYPVDEVCFWECNICGYKNSARAKYIPNHWYLKDIEEQNKEIIDKLKNKKRTNQ